MLGSDWGSLFLRWIATPGMGTWCFRKHWHSRTSQRVRLERYHNVAGKRVQARDYLAD